MPHPLTSASKRPDACLLDDDRAAITGMILAEVLQGFRRDEQADWVASSLQGLHNIEPVWDDWRAAAAKLGRQIAANGRRLPLTDLVIATLALRYDHAVLSTDQHFDPPKFLSKTPSGSPGSVNVMVS